MVEIFFLKILPGKPQRKKREKKMSRSTSNKTRNKVIFGPTFTREEAENSTIFLINYHWFVNKEIFWWKNQFFEVYDFCVLLGKIPSGVDLLGVVSYFGVVSINSVNDIWDLACYNAIKSNIFLKTNLIYMNMNQRRVERHKFLKLSCKLFTRTHVALSCKTCPILGYHLSEGQVWWDTALQFVVQY